MKKNTIFSVCIIAILILVVHVHAENSATVQPDSLIRGQSFSTIYYYAADGYRYVFPNEKIFKSWFSDFKNIITITDEELSVIPLKGNITYRPGVKMVKIQTNPKVYVVAPGGILKWIETEEIAKELYGDNWSKKIDDIPDAFFTNYQEGQSIKSSSDYIPNEILETAKTINDEKGIVKTTTAVRSDTTVGNSNTIPAIPAIPGNETATSTVPAVPAQSSGAISTSPILTPQISYILKQASYYHFSSSTPISNTNIAYELAYVTSYTINSPIDQIKVYLDGNINDSDIALIYLDKAGISNPDYNGNNLNDVILQRTVAYTASIINGVADIHLNSAFQINQASFPEIVIVFKSSASGKWTAAKGIDFYYQGVKFNQDVSIYNPNPAPTTTPPLMTTPPPITAKATSTINLWDNVLVTSDETDWPSIDVTGYKTAQLTFVWSGVSGHECQYRARGANNDGTFYYFSGYSCVSSSGASTSTLVTPLSLINNTLTISAWTPANGTLSGTLILFP